MYLERRKYFLCLAAAWLCFSYKTVVALEFKSGVGIGADYTDNSKLASANIEDELKIVSLVNANVDDSDGFLKYTGDASFTRHHYSKDTFEDKNYLKLVADLDWEMVKNRFNWIMSDRFTQRSIAALNSNTPDNLQDSNVFMFGANILFPISARQKLKITPTFRRYYYEESNADSDQYALTADWNYHVSRLTRAGLTLSAREVSYTEDDVLGLAPPDATFRTLAFVINGERVSLNYTINLGVTSAQRDGEEDFSGFSGGVFWNVDVSSRSEFNARLSSEITDTGSVISTKVGSDDDVQLVADVTRNSVFKLDYSRDDVDLSSRIWVEYRELKYNNEPLDQIVRATGVQLEIPGSPLFSSRISVKYKQSERLDTDRLDDSFVVKGGFNYRFSRRLRSDFDLQYFTKESSLSTENYNALTVSFNLTYGFGDIGRP